MDIVLSTIADESHANSAEDLIVGVIQADKIVWDISSNTSGSDRDKGTDSQGRSQRKE